MKTLKFIAGIISAYGLVHLSACSDYVQKMENEHDVWVIQQSLNLEEPSSSSVSTVVLSSSAESVSSSSAVASSSSRVHANEESGKNLSSVAQSSSSVAVATVSSSSEAVSVSSSAVSASMLAATANANYSTYFYQTWKSFHYVTLEDESAYYSDIAGDFGEVFSAQFQPAARVVWSAMTVGAYRSSCSDENATVANMKFRGCSVSEGTGYGMLLTYFNGDDDAFVRIWNYSRAYRDYFEQNLTPWITYSFYFRNIASSSATDADLDIATALILMYYKTGTQACLTDALKIVHAIWDNEINKSNLLVYSGDESTWQGSNPVYNLSYFSPVAIRLFAQVDPAHNWTGVLDAMYAYMAKVQAAGTGVFPDWSNGSGVAADPGNGSADKTYWTFNKEAVRIPWRIAWDYYWYNEPRALAILQTLNNFIVTKSGGAPSSSALGVNYSWDPAKSDITGSGTTVPVQWLAAWCATGIGTNPAWLNSCTSVVNSTVLTNSTASYYADVLLTVYSALLNGAFVKPF